MSQVFLSKVRRAAVGLLFAIASAGGLASEQPPSVEWQRVFSEPALIASYQQMKDGSYRIVGNRAQGMFLLAIGPDGNTLWERTFANQGGEYIGLTSDDGCVLTGVAPSPPEKPRSAFLLKLDERGNQEWQRIIDVSTSEEDHPIYVDERPGGGFVLIGNSRTYGAPFSSNIFVVGTDAQGTVIWQRAFSGLGVAEALSARRAKDGGFIIAAKTHSEGRELLYLLKINSMGQIVWEKYFPEKRCDIRAAALGTTRDGGSIAAVFSNRLGDGGGMATESFLLRMDSLGNVIWEKSFFNQHEGYCYAFLSIMQAEDGGFVLGGAKLVWQVVESQLSTCGSGCLIKTDAQGTILWEWLTRCEPWNPPNARYNVVIGGPTADGGFLALVNHVADDGTGIRALGFDVVKLRGTTPVTGRLTGRVVDASTGKGVSGAMLLLEPDPLTYCPITDDSGQFSFNVPAGTYNITAVADGYLSQTKAGVTVEAGQTVVLNFVLVRVATKVFWVEVAHSTESGVTIYDKYTSPRQAMIFAPNGWVMLVVDTYNDMRTADGVTWWEVRDSTWPPELTGWVDKNILRRIEQRELVAKAQNLEDRSRRREVFLNAVLHYYFDESAERSLYSSGDRVHKGQPSNSFKKLRDNKFPIELIMAIALQEGAAQYGFDNRIYDQEHGRAGNLKSGGVGVMQIHGGVFPCAGCNKGWGSGLLNYHAYDNGAYVADMVYKHDYYGNTPQGIYANVKDAFRILQYGLDKTNSVLGAVSCYNTGPTYPAKVGSWLPRLKEYYGENYDKTLEAGGYKPLTNDELLSLAGTLSQYIHAQLKSAASLQVWDPVGRVTGLVEGVVRNEIPDSAYLDEIVIIFGRDPSYRYVVIGGSDGSYDLVLTRATGDDFLQFESREVNTRAGAIHQYKVDWESLARGERGVTIEVDQDGDGVFELTLRSGSKFTGEELQHTITATAGKGGVIVPSGAVKVVHGADQTFTITPDEGYVIHDVLVDGRSVLDQVVMKGRMGTYKFVNVTSDHTIHAIFAALRTGAAVNHGPNPVPEDGCVFWFQLPEGTRSAKLLIYNVTGRLVAEISLDPKATRYPPVGRWRPVDQTGTPLANGPYIYVLVGDGKVIGQGKMVIQR